MPARIKDLIFPVGSRRDARLTFNAPLRYLTGAGLAGRLTAGLPPGDPSEYVVAHFFPFTYIYFFYNSCFLYTLFVTLHFPFFFFFDHFVSDGKVVSSYYNSPSLPVASCTLFVLLFRYYLI